MLSLTRHSGIRWALKLSRLFCSERLEGLVYDRHGPPSDVLTVQRTAVPAVQPHQVLVDFIAVWHLQPYLPKQVHSSLETL